MRIAQHHEPNWEDNLTILEKETENSNIPLRWQVIPHEWLWQSCSMWQLRTSWDLSPSWVFLGSYKQPHIKKPKTTSPLLYFENTHNLNMLQFFPFCFKALGELSALWSRDWEHLLETMQLQWTVYLVIRY